MINYLEDLFNFLKGLNQFQEYKNYQEYSQRKFGFDKEKNMIDKLVEDFDFEDTLNEKDKTDFEFMFGESED